MRLRLTTRPRTHTGTVMTMVLEVPVYMGTSMNTDTRTCTG
ncbi:hypothetical protein [Corynebacterium pyruviciproducens]|uniref:Uncharacterized protein n=1 Tax=Corynebacterium pyruviciproducens TaxID=598660 RepID=A0AAF0YPL8_9CORY|nr:hypothetical protein [Corynebacterium pyruviciproducens]WOT01090.1 hypothetical protein CYJ47_07245 [Corynebacterium pyruviciproducens]